MMVHKDFASLQDMIDRRQFSALRQALKGINAVDIADFMQQQPIEQALLVFRMLDKETSLYAFAHFDDDMQHSVINAITDKEVASLMSSLWTDDAVDMLEEMPATLVKKVLRNSSMETRERINQYLNYPEYSAGRVMTAEYVDLKKNMTVRDALLRVKELGKTAETIYTCFVTDQARILESSLPLKGLLFAQDDQIIGELVSAGPIYVSTTTDQEEAAHIMMKYNLISLPVVDGENRLVGIITVDDAVDVLTEEETEDFEKMAAVRHSETPYSKTTAFALARNRLPWLVISLLTNIVISFVVDIYEPVYVAMPILVSFMPMLMGTGGNAGSQTSTLVIRGMALGDITFKDFWRVLWKETRVCIALGLVLGIINFARIAFLGGGQLGLAAVVSVALVCGMLVGKTTGAALPMLAKAVGIDPALMSSPLITTIVDILAVVVFFSLSQAVFSLV
jgi:Mg2+ transporter (mgtE)